MPGWCQGSLHLFFHSGFVLPPPKSRCNSRNGVRDSVDYSRSRGLAPASRIRMRAGSRLRWDSLGDNRSSPDSTQLRHRPVVPGGVERVENGVELAEVDGQNGVCHRVLRSKGREPEATSEVTRSPACINSFCDLGYRTRSATLNLPGLSTLYLTWRIRCVTGS